MQHGLINYYIQFAELKKPVEFRITRKPAKFVAEYQTVYNKRGEIKKHIIWIHLHELKSDVRDECTIIVHELIHAMQAEGCFEEIHGPFFIRQAKRFKKEFVYLGDVFDPTIDE